MSAAGQGGISIITGSSHAELAPVTIPAFGNLVWTHNVGRIAFQVLVTDSNGNVLSPQQGIVVTQTTSALTVSNGNESDVVVYIAPRWEENTVELNLIPPGDSRVVIQGSGD